MIRVPSLPIEQEDVLIEILSSDFLRHRKVSEVLKSPKFKDIVPARAKDRKKFTNRRHYLLRSPEALRSATSAYNHRKAFIINHDICENPIATRSDTSVDNEHSLPTIMAPHYEPQDDYDIEIPLSWNPRHNIGAIQFYQGETEVQKNHEIKKQIRFSIQIPNAKDYDLYSARLSRNRDGIILTEPVLARHLRDADNLERFARVACAVKNEEMNLNLKRDVSVKVQEINMMDPPVKKTFFKFPGSMTCNNRSFNDDDRGNPPVDSLTLLKWPFMVPDGELDLPELPRKQDGVDDMGQKIWRPYDNFVPGFFWDMALDVEKVERTAHKEKIMDPNALANRLETALYVDG
jgi:hypothetical protein